MSKLFFRKELVSNPFLVAGEQVPFEVLNGNVGVIVLDTEKATDAGIIAALDRAAAKGIMGIIKTSEAEYEDVKKKQALVTSNRRLPQKDPLRIMPRDLSPFPRAGAAVDSVPEEKPKAELLRTDGPTLEEYVAAGMKAENYPPRGYAPREKWQPPTRMEPSTPSFPEPNKLPEPPAPAQTEKAPELPVEQGPKPAIAPKTQKLPAADNAPSLKLEEKAPVKKSEIVTKPQGE